MNGETNGALIISLDFELYWGLRDVLPLGVYRENLLGARRAVPALLALFQAYGIHATWATVGFLFCSGREELLANLPRERPQYRDARLSPYADLETIGRSEAEDPFHFAPSLIRRIAAAPNQEIGTHTLSHYYCLEPEQNIAAFRADLAAARTLAAGFGIPLRSLVFPRNQYSSEYVAAAGEMGIAAYRGHEPSWGCGGESVPRRLARYCDSFINFSGDGCFGPTSGDVPRNLPASRFLRPWSRSSGLEGLRLRRVLRSLEHAARNRLQCHLWWHPHNFGVNLERNLGALERILDFHSRMREQYGMSSLNMAEAAPCAATKLRESVVSA